MTPVIRNELTRIEPRPRIGIVALPVEHGGWAFVLEPIILGLLVATTYAGLCIAISSLGLFLARHPLKLALGDNRRKRNLPRTKLAWRFAAIYLSASVVFLTIALGISGRNFLLPFVLAAPLTCVQLFFDIRGQSRALPAELVGGLATGSIAAAIGLAGGLPLLLAFGLWAAIVLRSVPSILYVRARLRIIRRRHAPVSFTILAHALSLGLVLLLVRTGLLPLLAAAAIALLAGRAALGLWTRNQSVTAKRIGLQEIGYGVFTIYAVVLGHALGF